MVRIRLNRPGLFTDAPPVTEAQLPPLVSLCPWARFVSGEKLSVCDAVVMCASMSGIQRSRQKCWSSSLDFVPVGKTLIAPLPPRGQRDQVRPTGRPRGDHLGAGTERCVGISG